MRPYETPGSQGFRADQGATSTEQPQLDPDLSQRDLLQHLAQVASDARELAHHAAAVERLVLRLCGRVSLPLEYVAAGSRTGHQTVAGACVPECPACEVRS